MRKTVAAVCAAVCTAFALGACGQGEDAEAKDAIRASVLENAKVVDGVTLTEEQAECFADGMVDEVGVEQLQEYELVTADLAWADDADPTMSQDDAEASASVITGCVDMAALIREQIDAQAETELTDEQSQCIADAIDEDDIEAGLAASLQGEDEDNPLGESMGALMACVMTDLG